MSAAPQALYWYHQQPRAAEYRNSSSNKTGPYITELDMTGQPGVFKLVKYVPETEVAKLAAAMLAKNPPPPIVINNPDVASVVNAAIMAERERAAKLVNALEKLGCMKLGAVADGIVDKAIAAAKGDEP